MTIPAGSAYRVVFEVVNGNRQGDIAIDDYTQTPGSCGVRGNCNFDKGFCTWTNDHAYDRFDWTLGHGSTVSTNTGPTNDHTQGNSNGIYYHPKFLISYLFYSCHLYIACYLFRHHSRL